ncbi:hypothetical protein [Halonatronum saccharophilum]|uniref:hypothetical protein n=1 Tax=Halonatronum saccharophilum TaxID=150060 RepID=UPI000480AD54|nr:hypothetical protein [Halonatronum saccharophilum]
MEVLKKDRFQGYPSGVKRELKLRVDHLFNSYQDQRPGYLSLRVSDYMKGFGRVRFYGVKEFGEEVSGEGVRVSKVINKSKGSLILLFNISKLTKSSQFTEDTVEGVLTLDGSEIGRIKVESNPAIYLG